MQYELHHVNLKRNLYPPIYKPVLIVLEAYVERAWTGDRTRALSVSRMIETV